MAESEGNSGQDWQVHRSVVDCNRYMLEHEVACDVYFLVGGEESRRIKIGAHKYILISRSPVFYAMLQGDLQETAEFIKVPDTEDGAFRQMLRYMYCDSVDLTLDLVLPTLYLAKKYILPALADRCVQYLEDNLAPENVCLIYEQSMFYDEKQLIDKCTAFIETRSEDIIMASGFLDISHETLMNILKFDKLTVAELDLFKACLAWAEQECRRKDIEVCPENNRKMLHDALYCIRFPTMELSDFANVVAKTRIMTAEEKCAVFEYMTVDDCDHLDDIVKSLRFPTTYRQRPLPSVLKRFTAFGKSNVYSGDCSIMKLQCDKPVLLKGLGIHGSTSYDALGELTVTIKQDKKTLLTSSIYITDDRSGDCMHIMLPENVVLRSSMWYTVIVTFHFYGENDQGSCKRGRGGYRCITSDGVSFDFDRADSAGFLSEVLFCRV